MGTHCFDNYGSNLLTPFSCIKFATVQKLFTQLLTSNFSYLQTIKKKIIIIKNNNSHLQILHHIRLKLKYDAHFESNGNVPPKHMLHFCMKD